ncbi:PrgI family protein [Candidatus Gracilibacteria bacterium]|nr:PrgI family protein [Candidatus Gracilibacteria bacterium]
MQYKIPLQIENEDIIVAGLSLRQLIIMMVWGGLAYTVFKNMGPKVGPTIAAFLAAPLAITGITIALTKIYEMTFLPAILNYIRLSLNAKSRIWSVGTDSFSDLEVGYVTLPSQTKETKQNESIESKMTEEISQKINKL